MGLGFDELSGLFSKLLGQFRVLQEWEESGLEAFRRIDAKGASEFDHFFGFQGIKGERTVLGLPNHIVRMTTEGGQVIL